MKEALLFRYTLYIKFRQFRSFKFLVSQSAKINIQTFPNLEMAVASNAGTFQAVVLFQVLEHISQFKEVLDSSHKLLQKGGRITLTVPDVEAMIRQEKLTGCADMPPNHICKWSQKSLIQALRKAGLNIAPCTRR